MFLYESTRSNDGHLEWCRQACDLTYPAHLHRCLELDFCVEGETEITVDGAQYTVHCGECAVIPPAVIHSYASRRHSRLWVMFVGRDHIRDAASLFDRFLPRRFVFTVDPVLWEMVKSNFVTEQSVYAVKALVYRSLDGLLAGNTLLRRTAGMDELSVRILDYIQENFREELTLDTLAHHMGYSHDYISRLFRTRLNTTFTSLLAETRVACAREMLREGGESITAIALSCGFGSIRSFNRVFRQVEGMTPGEYIHSIRP